jgi:DNA polymerase-1
LTTALIDGDILVYLAASVVQKTTDWDDGLGAQVSTDMEEAARVARESVQKWASAAGCDSIVVTLSDLDHNFRKTLTHTYKAHRKAAARPLAFDAVRTSLAEDFKVVTIPGLEADDVMGIMHTSDRYRGKSVIVSLDKDMQTVPGTHFNPKTSKRPARIMPSTATLFWMTQVLTGDTVDNIKGIPKVGPVKAAAILGRCRPTLGELWPAVVEAYRQAKLPEAEAILNARLTRILQRDDYHRDTQEISLWHPTTPRRLSLQTSRTASSPPASAPEPPAPGPSRAARTTCDSRS